MANIQLLMHEIDQRRSDLIQLTKDLIAIPTLNPPGLNYREICEFLHRRLSKSGFEASLLRAVGSLADSDKNPRWNVVARKSGIRAGECVHFNSHTDVVQVGHGWTVDPFGGHVADGKIFGRGACDMKGGMAASIIAAEAFAACFPDFSGSIEISGTADEESGGYGGVAWLAEQGYFAPDRVDHVIIPEPLNKNRICLGHRGVWWAELETKGRIAHGSMPFLGVCAVRNMGAVVTEIEQNLIPALARKHTSMPVVPDGARQSTINLNAIHGGEPVQDEDYTGLPASCVPDRCRLTLDRRYLFEETADEVRGEIRGIIDRLSANRPGFDCEMRELFHVEPVMTEKNAPVARTVSKAIEQVLRTEPEYVVSPGTYDQKHIDRIGRMKNCIAYGPGILDLAHQPDEWISIEDMLDSAKVMSLTLAELLLPKND